MKKYLLLTVILLQIVFLTRPLPAFAYGSIAIDGYYADWEDKPHTDVYYGTSEIHHMALFRDGDRVYVHVKLSENGYSQYHNTGVNLQSNAGSMAYAITLDSLSGSSGTAGLQVRLRDNWNQVVGNGYYTRYTDDSDDAEFVIPLSSLSSQPPDSITDIRMTTSGDFGPQQIICVGVSTGPYIGVAIGAAIACAGVGYWSYRRQHPSRAMKTGERKWTF